MSVKRKKRPTVWSVEIGGEALGRWNCWGSRTAELLIAANGAGVADAKARRWARREGWRKVEVLKAELLGTIDA